MSAYVLVRVACMVWALVVSVQSLVTVTVFFVLVLTPLTWVQKEQKDAPVERFSRSE